MWLPSKLPVFQAVNTWCPNFRTLTLRNLLIACRFSAFFLVVSIKKRNFAAD